MKKTLKERLFLVGSAIAIYAGLSFGLATGGTECKRSDLLKAIRGEYKNIEYNFNGYIENNRVKFYEKNFGTQHYLEVTMPDGNGFMLVDRENNDMKIDATRMFLNNDTLKNNEELRECNGKLYKLRDEEIKEMQKTFDEYLIGIRIENISDGKIKYNHEKEKWVRGKWTDNFKDITE